jgi:hypothetical protein
MTTTLRSLNPTLYQEDYYSWLEITLQQVKDQNAENLDWQHLAEEIEALGSEQRRAVESYLKHLLIHLLLYRYWETEKHYCQRGWKLEITNFRDELEFYLRSKTLHNYFLKSLDSVYLKARRQAIQKTNLSPENFPKQCPFSPEDILDSDYFPD